MSDKEVSSAIVDGMSNIAVQLIAVGFLALVGLVISSAWDIRALEERVASMGRSVERVEAMLLQKQGTKHE